MDELRNLLEHHRSIPFPAEVERGGAYGDVDAVMIDADIFGWALRAADGNLAAMERGRLRTAHDELVRSLDAFPAAAQPYYRNLLTLAKLALGEDEGLDPHPG